MLSTHKDILGRELAVGSFVVIPYGGNQLNVCQVIGFTAKMVRVVPVKKKHFLMRKGFLRYGHDMAIMPGEEVFVHTLETL